MLTEKEMADKIFLDARIRVMRLEAALRAVEANHSDDSYGCCVICYQPNSDDLRQAWPCASVRVVREALDWTNS